MRAYSMKSVEFDKRVDLRVGGIDRLELIERLGVDLAAHVEAGAFDGETGRRDGVQRQDGDLRTGRQTGHDGERHGRGQP